jgi:hypothetical protein
MSDIIEVSKAKEKIDEIYMNKMQIKVNLIDAKISINEIARAGGKTHGIFAPRMIRVGYDMPQERSFICHATYIALLTNVVPTILAAFNEPQGESRKPLLKEGIHYVVGTRNLPKHFILPRYEIENPKHAIIMHTGHVFQLAATDQPESVAGASGVHAFIEEMKHNKGNKFKSRVIPALRNGLPLSRRSHLYQGITGVTDVARIDMGEDAWFESYENLMDESLINDIASVALKINQSEYDLLKGKNIEKSRKTIKHWKPLLNVMRKNAVYFLRASTFVNKDLLGYDYFKTQFETLDIEEFLTSIANIRRKKVTDMFFGRYNDEKHEYDDSYIYDSILKFDLKESFRITSKYLKHHDPAKPLILGYDPGFFSSLLVGQEKYKENEFHFIKELYVYNPQQHADLARNFNEFFKDRTDRHLELYYDRAANQKKYKKQFNDTDARILKSELEKLGWIVRLKNLGQRTIYHYEHYNLLSVLFGEDVRHTPRIRIDSNECKHLCSAIKLSPAKRKDGYIELDKTSEEKVPLQNQAGLTTQLPSAAMYLLFGMYEKYLPEKMRRTPNMPDNISA